MNKCHLAKLSLATLLAPSTLEMPVLASVVAKTKKVGKYCFGAIIESTIDYNDFTYADKKVWWSIH